MSILKKLGVLLACLSFASVPTAKASDVKPERIRGDIVSLQGDILTVHRSSGDTVSVEIKPEVGVSAVRVVNLADVKVGSYVGAAAIAGADGRLTASALLLFPEAARGTNEGHFPYDFGPKSTMTNANVDAVVAAASGRQLTLSYKGGSRTVTVPESAPVVTFAPATRADLATGKKVVLVVIPTQKNVYEARVVLVEKDGVVPPL